uniref:Uncharacterized protein n=1 Tax=Rhizophora mucronata TaxID=61149 RepID=A0A2P2M7Y1_RHIMU
MTSSVCSFSLLLFIIDLSYYSSFLGLYKSYSPIVYISLPPLQFQK